MINIQQMIINNTNINVDTRTAIIKKLIQNNIAFTSLGQAITIEFVYQDLYKNSKAQVMALDS